MIRRFLAAAVLLAMAACSKPAPVDMTAWYSRDQGSPIVVKAAANGDSRVDAGERVYIRRGGVDYVVLRDAKGSFAARESDLLALYGQAADPAAPRPQPEYAISEAGPETVSGFGGTVWKVHPKDVPSLPAVDAVISTDPLLESVGRGLAMQTRMLITRNASMAGGLGNLEKRMLELFEKGTVLRLNNALKLDHVAKGPIAPGAFELPGLVLDRAALKARLAVPN